MIPSFWNRLRRNKERTDLQQDLENGSSQEWVRLIEIGKQKNVRLRVLPNPSLQTISGLRGKLIMCWEISWSSLNRHEYFYDVRPRLEYVTPAGFPRLAGQEEMLESHVAKCLKDCMRTERWLTQKRATTRSMFLDLWNLLNQEEEGHMGGWHGALHFTSLATGGGGRQRMNWIQRRMTS